MASLMILTGQNAHTHYQIANRPLSAGRDPARDIQLLDPKVSRKHFMICRNEDGYVLKPLPSLNGVLINGAGISTEWELSDGDTIQVGDTTLRFCADDVLEGPDGLAARKLADRSAREFQTINTDSHRE